MTTLTGPRYPAVKYHYERKYFDPVTNLIVLTAEQALAGGDHPGATPYHYDEEIILAVNAALAAGRPLLVAGRAGTGKTALAANIAAQREWSYHSKVITGATEGRDLLWRFDAVRRLRDAHLASQDPQAASAPARGLAPEDYVARGVLWEAFAASAQGKGSVVLIDEIDKADPEVPNSLLEVLGNGKFTVEETGEEIVAGEDALPLMVITTNDERELSRPFRRRCVTLKIEPPDAGRLVEIAESWRLTDGDARGLARELADEVVTMTGGTSRTPNAAEYLDALRVCLKLKVRIGSDEWEAVKRATLVKSLDVGSQE